MNSCDTDAGYLFHIRQRQGWLCTHSIENLCVVWCAKGNSFSIVPPHILVLLAYKQDVIVVRSRKKSEYLEALHQADLEVGPVPSDGAHADIKDIRPFMKYFNELVATEVYNDVLFVSEKNENVWWYDGERIAFRTPNYTKILNAMRTCPSLTLADMKEETGISISAIQKLLDQLIQKKYVERGEKDGSWRVFMTQ